MMMPRAYSRMVGDLLLSYPDQCVWSVFCGRLLNRVDSLFGTSLRYCATIYRNGTVVPRTFVQLQELGCSVGNSRDRCWP